MPANIAHMVIVHKAFELLRAQGSPELAAFAGAILLAFAACALVIPVNSTSIPNLVSSIALFSSLSCVFCHSAVYIRPLKTQDSKAILHEFPQDFGQSFAAGFVYI